jgi:hypothetical protein
MKSLYRLPGVAPTSSAEELTSAFLRLKTAYVAERLAAGNNARLRFQGWLADEKRRLRGISPQHRKRPDC